jgi:hypothetical protein
MLRLSPGKRQSRPLPRGLRKQAKADFVETTFPPLPLRWMLVCLSFAAAKGKWECVKPASQECRLLEKWDNFSLCGGERSYPQSSLQQLPY